MLNHLTGLDKQHVLSALALGGGGASSSSLTPQQTAKASELALAAHLNLALCLLKVRQDGCVVCPFGEGLCPPSHAAPTSQKGKPERCVENCDRALALDPNNPKALFRRAKARTLLRDADGAEADLAKLEQVEPGNGDARALRVEVKKLRDEEARKSAEVYSKMFAKAQLGQ